MPTPWDQQQFKVLIGPDQRIDDLHGRSRIDVGIEFADNQLQMAFELMGVNHIRVGFIVRSKDRKSVV